jgi:hypothetical protein
MLRETQLGQLLTEGWLLEQPSLTPPPSRAAAPADNVRDERFDSLDRVRHQRRLRPDLAAAGGQRRLHKRQQRRIAEDPVRVSYKCGSTAADAASHSAHNDAPAHRAPSWEAGLGACPQPRLRARSSRSSARASCQTSVK